MSERVRSASNTTSAYYRCPKMENDLSPRKTMLVLVIVVGCFAVLWPKVFYPMLVGSANQHIKPSPIDKTTGCCDVISETDVNTIKIMSELCGTIIKSKEDDKPLTGKEIVQRCRQEVLETCGIDISVVLQEQVRLGQNVKQILDEVRSLNGSLCLKYNYGVAPWRLGVPHRITVKLAPDVPHIRQERPQHLRSELVHPAFRERGRAIPQPQTAPPSRPPPRIVEGRPGPLPGMRPTIGGAGHVVPPSKQGTSSMSVIMPIYTIGIVIFFTYTLMRIIFKKQPEGVGGSLYPPVEPDPHFRKEVFESEASRLGPRYSRDHISSKLVVNAMSALLDEVDQEIEARRKSNEVASQDLVNGTLSNGDVVKPQEAEDQPTVKVLGMEMTASCEGGKKWSRPDSPVLPTSPSPVPAEPVPPPQEIYLEGALPPQSHLLVADSATEPQPAAGEDPAIVLAGKMTLSVISLDSENETEEAKPPEEAVPTVDESFIQKERQEEEIQRNVGDEVNDLNEPEFEIEEYELHPLVVKKFDAAPLSKIQVEDLEKQIQESSRSAVITEQQPEVQRPLIHLESEEAPHQTVEVEELEKEVDDLIQEAIESIKQGKPVVEAAEAAKSETNETSDIVSNEGLQVEHQSSRNEESLSQVEEQPRLATEEVASKDIVVESSPKYEAKVESSEESKKESVIELVKSSIEGERSEDGKQKSEEKSDTTRIIDEPVEISEKIEKTQVTLEEAVKVDGTSSELEVTTEKESLVDTTRTDDFIKAEENLESKKEEEQKPEKTEDTVTQVVKSSIEVVKSEEEPKFVKTEDETQRREEKPETTQSTEKPVEVLEKIQAIVEETAKTDSKSSAPEIKKEVEPAVELAKPDDTKKTEEKPKPIPEEKVESKKEEQPPVDVVTDEDEELASDEELVEEIEEIVYEEESEEEEEEEGSEEEIRRITNRADQPSGQVNGERSEDVVEESKYTTVSGNTAAENDISDEELTDNEEVEDDEEEIIEVEEEEEVEDEDYAGDEGNDVNHVSGESEPEL